MLSLWRYTIDENYLKHLRCPAALLSTTRRALVKNREDVALPEGEVVRLCGEGEGVNLDPQAT